MDRLERLLVQRCWMDAAGVVMLHAGQEDLVAASIGGVDLVGARQGSGH